MRTPFFNVHYFVEYKQSQKLKNMMFNVLKNSKNWILDSCIIEEKTELGELLYIHINILIMVYGRSTYIIQIKFKKNRCG